MNDIAAASPLESHSRIIRGAMDWRSLLLGMVVGGGGLKIIDYVIAWKREKREQRSDKTSEQKDRPRFRVDVDVVATTHPTVPDAVVKIVSLGDVPLRINEGLAFIEASHYPHREQPRDFSNQEIRSIHPIELRFSLPLKLINPTSGAEVTVKLICQFSYGNDGRYRTEHRYNRQTRRFDLVNEEQSP